MTISLVLLILVVIIALAFDFTNGFHDTGNAMATSIATGALKPKTAVTISAILNLVGAFLSIEVALTVTNSIIHIQNHDGSPITELTVNNGYILLLILLSGLVSAILWNVFTWLLSIPSSSGHSLFGGLIGATIAAMGLHGVNWISNSTHGVGGVVGKIIVPAVASPIIALIISAIAMKIVYLMTNNNVDGGRGKYFRRAQIVTASMVSLAHGVNDAQKTMGIITLALIGYGVTTDTTSIPLWVKISCASAIALGTYIGGWRIIKTLGKGVVELSAPQGMTAELTSTVIILLSSNMGSALSTTHVASGSIIGVGVGKKDAKINWKLTFKMFLTWMVTLPIAIIVGFITYEIGSIGRVMGPILITIILIIFTLLMFIKSRKNPVAANDSAPPIPSNDDWESRKTTGVALGEGAITVVTGKKKRQPSFLARKDKGKSYLKDSSSGASYTGEPPEADNILNVGEKSSEDDVK